MASWQWSGLVTTLHICVAIQVGDINNVWHIGFIVCYKGAFWRTGSEIIKWSVLVRHYTRRIFLHQMSCEGTKIL